MRHSDSMQILARIAFIGTSALVILAAGMWGIRFYVAQHNQAAVPPTSTTEGIAGFPMAGSLAPDFKLTDQFGQSVTLSSLRGREIVLAFIDSRCTSLCPLTAEIMYDAKAQLGSSQTSKVALVAINANPTATSIAVIQSWSITHGMLHQWLFLTGTAQQLEAVYHAYHILVEVTSNGTDIHDAATIIIDAQGHERLYFETLDSNSKSDLSDEEVGMVAGMHQWLPHN
jgi:cytochrome oxidase Cu insertion factor (SCO1/SenC/PrrC family)